MSTVVPPPVLDESDSIFVRAVAREFSNYGWEREELESIVSDAVRLIRSIATKYTDNSRVELNFSELESEGRARFIKRLQGTERSPSALRKFALTDGEEPDLARVGRGALFRHFKSCLSNHIKGIVYRNIYTAKRTGRKSPLKRIEDVAELFAKAVDSEDYRDLLLDTVNELGGDFKSIADFDKKNGAKVEELEEFRDFLTDKEEAAVKFANSIVDKHDHSWRPDVSLNNPDVSRSVELSASEHDGASRWDRQEILDFESDMERILLPAEQVVYRQLTEPNSFAVGLAMTESYRGRKVHSKIDIKITQEHLAAGIGLDAKSFSDLSDKIKQKVSKYMQTEESGHSNAAIASLEKIFAIQIPRAMPSGVVRRLLTLVARDNIVKVTPEVEDLLKLVGAKPPAFDKNDKNGGMACFGVLFQKNHRTCSICGLGKQCEMEAANYDLGQVALSPKLFSEKSLQRTAAFSDAPVELPVESAPAVEEIEDDAAEVAIPSVEAPKPVVAPVEVREPELSSAALTVKDETVKSYLEGNFKAQVCDGQLYYRHKERNGKPRYIFWHNHKDGVLALRFCNPSEKLAKHLEKHKRGTFYAPPDISMDQLKKLINQHADETYTD